MAAKSPQAVQFDADEVERLERAELILLGVQPSEVDRMAPDERWDVLELHLAQAKLRNRRRK